MKGSAAGLSIPSLASSKSKRERTLMTSTSTSTRTNTSTGIDKENDASMLQLSIASNSHDLDKRLSSFTAEMALDSGSGSGADRIRSKLGTNTSMNNSMNEGRGTGLPGLKSGRMRRGIAKTSTSTSTSTSTEELRSRMMERRRERERQMAAMNISTSSGVSAAGASVTVNAENLKIEEDPMMIGTDTTISISTNDDGDVKKTAPAEIKVASTTTATNTSASRLLERKRELMARTKAKKASNTANGVVVIPEASQAQASQPQSGSNLNSNSNSKLSEVKSRLMQSRDRDRNRNRKRQLGAISTITGTGTGDGGENEDENDNKHKHKQKTLSLSLSSSSSLLRSRALISKLGGAQRSGTGIGMDASTDNATGSIHGKMGGARPKRVLVDVPNNTNVDSSGEMDSTDESNDSNGNDTLPDATKKIGGIDKSSISYLLNWNPSNHQKTRATVQNQDVNYGNTDADGSKVATTKMPLEMKLKQPLPSSMLKFQPAMGMDKIEESTRELNNSMSTKNSSASNPSMGSGSTPSSQSQSSEKSASGVGTGGKSNASQNINCHSNHSGSLNSSRSSSNSNSNSNSSATPMSHSHSNGTNNSVSGSSRSGSGRGHGHGREKSSRNTSTNSKARDMKRSPPVSAVDTSQVSHSHVSQPQTRQSFTSVSVSASASASASASVHPDFLKIVSFQNIIHVKNKPYIKLGVIGKGGSCKVYRTLSKDREIVAIKKVKLAGMTRKSVEGYANEISLLRRLRGNPAIIQMYDSEVDLTRKAIFLVMEPGEVDLNHVLQQQKSQKGSVNMNFIRLTWQQMLSAVHCIHEERIIHGDLKPANFLFVKGVLKLIDFGIAKAIQCDDTTNIYRESQVGTLNYMSPESILDTGTGANSAARMKCGRPSDVWSLGCILYQMCYSQTPFADLHMIPKLQAIINEAHEIDFPDTIDESAVDAMKLCLRRNADDRAPIIGNNGLLNEHWFLHSKHERDRERTKR